jgi:transposase
MMAQDRLARHRKTYEKLRAIDMKEHLHETDIAMKLSKMSQERGSLARDLGRLA